MELRRPIYLFVLSLTMISVLRLVNKEFGILGDAAFTLGMFLCLGICIYACTKLVDDFEIESGYLKWILPIFFFYQTIVMLRGMALDYSTIKELLQSDYLFWIYIIPLLIFFNKSLVTFAILSDIIFYLAIFFLIGAIAYPAMVNKRANAETYNHAFAFASGFILLNARYFPKKKYIVAFLALSVGVVSFVFLARRNGIVSYGALILSSIALNARNLTSSRFFKVFPGLAAVAIIVMLNTDALPASFTKRLNDRLTEDSRSYVVDNLMADMEEDQIFGKGMKGVYYAPMGGGGPNEDGVEFSIEEYRQVIENGYLQQFLNGGIVYIALFLLVLLPAVFLGVFKSNNQFCQACGIIVFLWLIDMAIFGLPRLTLEYFLVWICAGVCYKKSIRDKSEEEVTEVFANYKDIDYENSVVH